MSKQTQIPRRSFAGLDPEFQAHYQQMIDTVNSLQGYNGPIVLNDHIDMNGKLVKNLGAATGSGDAVSSAVAQQSYSAQALRPALEAGGKTPLQTVRRIGDQNQREPYSTFLNDTLSTPPNANTTQVFFSPGAGGTTVITLPAGQLKFADGSTTPFVSRTDTVTNPTQVGVSSISGNGNIVTVGLSAAVMLAPNDVIVLAGVATNTSFTTSGYVATFNGTFPVATVIDQYTFTYVLPNIGSSTGSGGTLSTAGVYYYYVEKGSPILSRIAVATTADTPNRRLQTSTDNRQIVAVATVNANGGVPSLSAGGDTSTTGSVNAGSFF